MARSGSTGEASFQGPGTDVVGIAAQSTGSAPDFVRRDRGPEDDHWAYAFGAPCGRCGLLLEEGDFARRRMSGDWVHERCPVTPPA